MSKESFSTPLVVVPELFRTTGGVQCYSIRFIEALDQIYGEKVPVISMNDRREDFPNDFLKGRKTHGCGKGNKLQRKLCFLFKTLSFRSNSIFSTHPGPSPWLAILKRVFGTPFLCVAHGIDAWELAPSLSKAIASSDLILPVSQFTGQKLADQLPPKRPTFSILSNMVEESRFSPGLPRKDWRDALSIPSSAKVMLSICRISKTEHGKGYDLILEALPKLAIEVPSLIWVLGGKGDDLPRLQEKAKELGVDSHCRFPGFIADEELPDLYRSADLFVLPSQKEGFGIVFLEAAASGLPVIAGNRDGSVDALAGGKLGQLIDPENIDELTSAILACLAKDDHDPVALHHSCIERFGKSAFQNRLRNILTEHPNLSGNLPPQSVSTR